MSSRGQQTFTIIFMRLSKENTESFWDATDRVTCLFAGPVSEQTERLISRRPVSNTRHPSDRNLGPMEPLTRELLRLFYAPFNQKLSAVLQDESFTW